MQQSTTSFNTISGDFEFFQNYTASEVFIQQLATITNQSDISLIIKNQKEMLCKFEKNNAMLSNCNILSQNRLKSVTEDYRKHCKLLIDMKKDLEYIFKKTRAIKGKLESKYPDAFKSNVMNNVEEERDEESEGIDYQQLESTKNIDAADEATQI